jgi:hypothetical protein
LVFRRGSWKRRKQAGLNYWLNNKRARVEGETHAL